MYTLCDIGKYISASRSRSGTGKMITKMMMMNLFKILTPYDVPRSIDL